MYTFNFIGPFIGWAFHWAFHWVFHWAGSMRCCERYCATLFFTMYTADRNSSVISVLLRITNGVSFICKL